MTKVFNMIITSKAILLERKKSTNQRGDRDTRDKYTGLAE